MGYGIGAEFGFQRQGRNQIRNILGQWERKDAEILLRAELLLDEYARALQAAVAREFEEHNRKNQDVTLDPGHVYTIDTLRITGSGLARTVSMDGAANLIETGWPEHIIEASAAQALHWEDADSGEDAFANWVLNPGYEGDPFFERAWKDVNVVAMLQKQFRPVFAATNFNPSYGWIGAEGSII